MPEPGQVLINPVTGETITFVRPDGPVFEAVMEVTPGGSPPAAHFHPRSTETFRMHEGVCRAVIGGEERVLRAGDVAVVPPGVPHIWEAVEPVKMTVTIEPSLRAAEFFEDLFGLVRAGYADEKGLPTPLHFAVLCDDYRDLVYLAAVPVWLQRVAFAALARVGRRLGRGPAVLRPAAA